MSPIDPWVFAASLDVIVLGFGLLGLKDKDQKQLLVTDHESWSGLTLKEGSRHFVVVNPSHPIGRQRNTLMHEIAHINLGHVPGRVDITDSGLMLLSDYPDDQEQEADWLAAALLVPRDALRHRRKAGMAVEEIAVEFGVSRQLVDWRLRMTGVEAQMRRSAPYSRAQ